jgi:hypothetical protein
MLLVLPYYNYGKKKARETEKKVRGKNPGLRRTFSRICSKTFCTTTIGRKKRGKPKKKVRACAEHFPVFFSKTFCTTTIVRKKRGHWLCMRMRSLTVRWPEYYKKKKKKRKKKKKKKIKKKKTNGKKRKKKKIQKKSGSSPTSNVASAVPIYCSSHI